MKAILTLARTEEGKALRRQKKDVGIKFKEGRQWMMRTDGIANTLTSVLKDNLLMEIE